jgi:hypothetical protein
VAEKETARLVELMVEEDDGRPLAVNRVHCLLGLGAGRDRDKSRLHAKERVEPCSYGGVVIDENDPDHGSAYPALRTIVRSIAALG